MNQLDYHTVCSRITYFSDTKCDKTKRTLRKLEKLMDNEYKYGSSRYDLQQIFKYLRKLEQEQQISSLCIIKSNVYTTFTL